jgi:hypothetical protein
VRLGYHDGVPTFIDSIAELDAANPSWVISLPGVPKYLALNGNIVCSSPISDNTPHSITLDIQPNFPIPGPIGYIQIGNEIIDVVLDYAQHLAYIKEGIEEIKSSVHQYKSMLALAATQNDRLRAQSNNFDVLSDRTMRDEKFLKRRNTDVGLKELDYGNS